MKFLAVYSKNLSSPVINAKINEIIEPYLCSIGNYKNQTQLLALLVDIINEKNKSILFDNIFKINQKSNFTYFKKLANSDDNTVKLLNAFVFKLSRNTYIKEARKLSTQNKRKLLLELRKHHKTYLGYTVNVGINIANNDNDRLMLLETFYKSIDTEFLLKIVKDIKGQFKHPKVKEILSKTKKFNIINFDKNKVNKDQQERLKLLKHLANKPNDITDINYKVNVTYEDLKKLYPIQRFNFLKCVYENKFSWADYVGYYNNLLKYDRFKNIIMPNISIAKMKELLFTLSFKRNDEVQRFIDTYKKYKLKINKKS